MNFEPKPDRFEMICGLILSIFASFLALVQVADANYGDEEIKASNEKSQAYQWHQAKGIKQNLVESEVNLIETLLFSKSIATKDTVALRKNLAKLKAKVKTYEREKKEILKGSKVVGKENWVQDIDGEMGKVIGAKEWEARVDYYNNLGDKLAISSLFLQIGIVLGGMALVLQEIIQKKRFFWGMNILGIVGLLIAIMTVAFNESF
jgi:Domain of unknown function (DUF4337)